MREMRTCENKFWPQINAVNEKINARALMEDICYIIFCTPEQ